MGSQKEEEGSNYTYYESTEDTSRKLPHISSAGFQHDVRISAIVQYHYSSVAAMALHLAP
jgi:hypothetical protein